MSTFIHWAAKVIPSFHWAQANEAVLTLQYWAECGFHHEENTSLSCYLNICFIARQILCRKWVKVWGSFSINQHQISADGVVEIAWGLRLPSRHSLPIYNISTEHFTANATDTVWIRSRLLIGPYCRKMCTAVTARFCFMFHSFC